MAEDKTGYTGAPELTSTYHASGANLDIHATPDQFGAGVFGALHGLAETGEEAMLKRQELANSLDHDKRSIDTSQRVSQAWSKFGQLEGDAAVKGLPAFQEELKQIYNEAVQQAPNPAVRKMVADSAYRDIDRYMSHGANYADTQLRTWHEKLHTDALRNNGDQVMLNRKQPLDVLDDMVKNGANGVGGLNSSREKMLHKYGDKVDLNDPKVKAEIEGEVSRDLGKMVLPTIETLANENDLPRAKAMFEHFRNQMDAGSAKAVESFLRPRLAEEKAIEAADKRRPLGAENGDIPSREAAGVRQGIAETPTRENASRLGIFNPESKASGKHASDYFMTLESGNKGLGYINQKDTHGSHSYGNLGLNSYVKPMDSVWSTSAGKFWKEHADLGLTGIPGTPQADASWRKVAAERPTELRAAEEKWWDREYRKPVAPALKAAGVPDVIADNPRVQYYFADRNVQQGAGKMADHADRFRQAASVAGNDPNAFIKAMTAIDQRKVQGDFHSALNPKPGEPKAYSPESNDNRLSGREAAAARADAAMRGVPLAEPQPTTPQPASPLQPGYADKSKRQMDDREYAHAESRDENGNYDHDVENRIYTVLQQRVHDNNASMANEHERISRGLQSLDILAAKGVPNLTLDKANLTEEQVYAAFPKNPERAKALIETFKVQADNGNQLNALKFAPQDDVNAHITKIESGLGVSSLLEKLRKTGETGPGAMGATMTASEETVHRADLHAKIAQTSKEWDAARTEMLANNAAQWGESNQAPTIVAARQKMEAAKTPEEKIQAYEGYASAQISLQRQMGVPEHNIHVMTAKSAHEHADSIMKSPDPKGAMEQMAKQYGPLWNNIFKDMVTVGNLPVKYEMAQYLDDYNSRVLTNQVKSETQLSGQKEKSDPHALEKLLPDTPEGKSGKKVIDSMITQDKSMQDFMESLTRRGIRVSQREEIADTVRSLAYGRATGAGGQPREDHATAARESVAAFVKNYEFTSDNAMLPKAKAEDIKPLMTFIKDSMRNTSVNLPGFTEHGKEHGLPDQAEYLQRAKDNGTWVNTFNGDGVEYRDHTGRTMHYTDGKPVRIMFNNLADAQARMKRAQHFQEESGIPDAAALPTGNF
jgi:hypothetical protein